MPLDDEGVAYALVALRKIDIFSFLPNNSAIFVFFSPKGCYFPKYFVLLQMQPSRLRMIEAKASGCAR